ncbi:MAG: hypothetical protein IPL26_14750 [Leptospiraceae bacterium]|nr:hypothetical protein [Leptospiraceae bacterium]
MTIEVTDKQEIKLLSDIFVSPQDAFETYQRATQFSRFDLIRIHVCLFILAPIFKILHNLFFTYVGNKYWNWELPSKITDGLTTATVIYPAVLILIYYFDILLLKLRAGDAPIEVIPEKDILLISFLPFTASCIFWMFPKPINFFLILISLTYSFYLAQMALRTLFGFTAKQFIVFISYILIFCMTFSAVALAILNWIRK